MSSGKLNQKHEAKKHNQNISKLLFSYYKTQINSSSKGLNSEVVEK